MPGAMIAAARYLNSVGDVLKGKMPGFEKQLSRDRITAIVEYVISLRK
jgi:hypothetical protein